MPLPSAATPRRPLPLTRRGHIEDISLEALDLPVGESKRIYCPQCGAKDERSLKITRNEGGIFYTCFRGKCGFRGGHTRACLSIVERKTKYAKVRPFDRDTVALSPEQIRLLQTKYGLSLKEIRANRFIAEAIYPRLVMPMFDSVGDIVGYVSKRMKGTGGQKSFSHWHKETPNMHYPRCALSEGPVALTEDTLSSVRAARHLRARALLGTYIPDNAIDQLRLETDHVILALDNDVMDVMVKQARRLRGIFDIEIIRWPKDPKDMTDDAVKLSLAPYL